MTPAEPAAQDTHPTAPTVPDTAHSLKVSGASCAAVVQGAPVSAAASGALPGPPGSAGPVASRAWLAVEVAGTGLLLPLHQAGEIFPLPPMLPLAHSQPWFLGVANLRGGLHGVVDLACFLGLSEGLSRAPGAPGASGVDPPAAVSPSGAGASTPSDPRKASGGAGARISAGANPTGITGGPSSGRLLAVNPELRALCALKVDHLIGLRRLDDGLQAVRTHGARPSFAVGVWRDAKGRLWQELDLAALVASESFVAIAVADAVADTAANTVASAVADTVASAETGLTA